MRIVPDDAKFNLRDKTKVGHFKSYEPTFDVADTIEITDSEWDTIGHDYRCNLRLAADPSKLLKFSQYLHQLIELARMK